MGKRGMVTLTEVLAITLVLGLALAVVLYAVTAHRDESRRITCRNHLNCLAKSMATYLNECGGNKWYPCPLGRGLSPTGYTGAEWAATNFWVRIHPGPDCLLCPLSGDTNHDGRDLGTDRAVPGLFGSQTVSYAAMGDLSVGVYRAFKLGQGAGFLTSKLAVRDDFPPNEPMACDDTEGTPNHGGRGMSVLFFDSHVEYWTTDMIDPGRSVGVLGTALVHLRN
jgi:prepilin-type processing-associated H-X9-DG protein